MNCCMFYGNHLIDFHQYVTHDDWDDIKANVYQFMKADSHHKKVCIGSCSSVLIKGLTRYSLDSNITHLEIYDSFLFRYYVKLITQFCLLHSLQSLSLKSSFQYHDIEPFLHSFRRMTLKTLSLSGTKICKKTAKCLFHNLPDTLEEIDLSNCHLHNNSIRYLSNALSRKRKVKSLHLNYNRFLLDGIIHLAKILPSSNLVTLNLYGNRIGNSGIEVISKYLPTSYTLRELGMSKTFMHSYGFYILCSVLPLSRLTSFYVAENYLVEEDMKLFFFPVLPKTYISKLSWFSNLISYSRRIHLQNEINCILKNNLKKQKNHNNTFHLNLFLIQLEKQYDKMTFEENIICHTLNNYDLSNYIKSFLLYP